VNPLYYPDGQQRDEVYTHVSFLESRMNHAGVTCSDCHDPHTQRLRAALNGVCEQCHRAAKYDLPAHTLHPVGERASECVSCHMPSRTYMQIDPRLDHSIRIPRPGRTESVGVPNACNGCHSDKTAKWASQRINANYRARTEGFQRFSEAFVADDRNEPGAGHRLSFIASDTTEPSIARASALVRLAAHPEADALNSARIAANDPDALIRRSAVGLLDAYPPRDRVEIAAPLLRDSSRSVRIEAARILAPAASLLGVDAKNDFSKAAKEFIASERLQADRPENRVALGIFFGQLGRLDDAEGEYRASIRLDRPYTPAYVNLADVLRAQGRETDAEGVLRSGLAVSPQDATLHHALGLSLVRSGKLADALPELKQAAALAPDQAHFAYVYAVALRSAGRNREARSEEHTSDSSHSH